MFARLMSPSFSFLTDLPGAHAGTRCRQPLPSFPPLMFLFFSLLRCDALHSALPCVAIPDRERDEEDDIQPSVMLDSQWMSVSTPLSSQRTTRRRRFSPSLLRSCVCVCYLTFPISSPVSHFHMYVRVLLLFFFFFLWVHIHAQIPVILLLLLPPNDPVKRG